VSTINGGNRVAAALKAHGVQSLFTLCGGHISPILTEAKAQGIRIVDVRDEATAVFAADAAARLTGLPGVAAVTAGPGLTNTITAVKNAQLAQSPIIILGGAAPTALMGRGALQDIDQYPVIAPHVKLIKQVRRVGDLIPAVEEAFRISREDVPGPVFIECPVDLLYEESIVRQWYVDASPKGKSLADRLLRFYITLHFEKVFSGADEVAPVVHDVVLPKVPNLQIDRTIRALKKASRPIMVVGSQTLAVAGKAEQIATSIAKLGIPIYLSGMSRGLLGREHRLLMRHHRRLSLRDSDCVILAGVPCDFRLDYGRHIRRSSTVIAVNRSIHDAHLNRNPDIAVVADAGEFMLQLAHRLDDSGARWRGWTNELRIRDQAREKEIDDKARIEGEFVNPVALLKEIDRIASDTAIFVVDGGDFVATASYILRPRGPLSWLDPGPFGTLGVGSGFALGSKVCRPESEVWIIFGDGASGYGLVEFDTFVRHGIPVIAVVGNDAGWTQIAREQVKLLKDDVGTTLARTNYEQVAQGFGAKGILIKKNSDVGNCLNEARAIARSGQPVLINVWIDQTDFREGSISM
jgi:acetolactate synthase-1/2/3 large subunit